MKPSTTAGRSVRIIRGQTGLSTEDRREIASDFRRFGGSPESCISILERNGAEPVNKDALAETAGGATGPLQRILR